MNSFVDGHCDTLTKAYYENKHLRKNDLNIDFIRLKKYNNPVQFFAIWLSKEVYERGFLETLKIIDYLEAELNENTDIAGKALSYFDILKNKEANKISSILSIEGGEAIEGSIDNLNTLYNRGVRVMSLTWNYSNCLSGGAGIPFGGGLTSLGKDVVEAMNSLGIIVDVSHLSDNGFYDVADISKIPFIATHSNSRSICSSRRNLTDEQIKIIGNRGGIIGLNLYPDFLSEGKEADFLDIYKNINHIINIGGSEVLGLGCDFDGIESMPKGIVGIESIYDLFDWLSLKLNSTTIEKISEKNFLRLIKDVL